MTAFKLQIKLNFHLLFYIWGLVLFMVAVAPLTKADSDSDTQVEYELTFPSGVASTFATSAQRKENQTQKCSIDSVVFWTEIGIGLGAKAKANDINYSKQQQNFTLSLNIKKPQSVLHYEQWMKENLESGFWNQQSALISATEIQWQPRELGDQAVDMEHNWNSVGLLLLKQWVVQIVVDKDHNANVTLIESDKGTQTGGIDLDNGSKKRWRVELVDKKIDSNNIIRLSVAVSVPFQEVPKYGTSASEEYEYSLSIWQGQKSYSQIQNQNQQWNIAKQMLLKQTKVGRFQRFSDSGAFTFSTFNMEDLSLHDDESTSSWEQVYDSDSGCNSPLVNNGILPKDHFRVIFLGDSDTWTWSWAKNEVKQDQELDNIIRTNTKVQDFFASAPVVLVQIQSSSESSKSSQSKKPLETFLNLHSQKLKASNCLQALNFDVASATQSQQTNSNKNTNEPQKSHIQEWHKSRSSTNNKNSSQQSKQSSQTHSPPWYELNLLPPPAAAQAPLKATQEQETASLSQSLSSRSPNITIPKYTENILEVYKFTAGVYEGGGCVDKTEGVEENVADVWDHELFKLWESLKAQLQKEVEEVDNDNDKASKWIWNQTWSTTLWQQLGMMDLRADNRGVVVLNKEKVLDKFFQNFWRECTSKGKHRNLSISPRQQIEDGAGIEADNNNSKKLLSVDLFGASEFFNNFHYENAKVHGPMLISKSQKQWNKQSAAEIQSTQQGQPVSWLQFYSGLQTKTRTGWKYSTQQVDIDSIIQNLTSTIPERLIAQSWMHANQENFKRHQMEQMDDDMPDMSMTGMQHTSTNTNWGYQNKNQIALQYMSQSAHPTTEQMRDPKYKRPNAFWHFTVGTNEINAEIFEVRQAQAPQVQSWQNGNRNENDKKNEFDTSYIKCQKGFKVVNLNANSNSKSNLNTNSDANSNDSQFRLEETIYGGCYTVSDYQNSQASQQGGEQDFNFNSMDSSKQQDYQENEQNQYRSPHKIREKTIFGFVSSKLHNTLGLSASPKTESELKIFLVVFFLLILCLGLCKFAFCTSTEDDNFENNTFYTTESYSIDKQDQELQQVQVEVQQPVGNALNEFNLRKLPNAGRRIFNKSSTKPKMQQFAAE